MNSTDLRPREIGELIDRSVSFWRMHFKALFAIALGFHLALYAISKVLAISAMRLQQSMGDDFSHVDPVLLMQTGALFAGLMLVYFWISIVSQVAASAYVIPNVLGTGTTPGAALRRSLERFGATTGSFVLVIGWFLLAITLALIPMVIAGVITALNRGTALGLAAFVIAMILSIVLMVAVVLFGWVRFLLLGPVLAYEPGGTLAAFRRSKVLVNGRIGPDFTDRVQVRAAILLTAIGVILLVVGLISGLPALIITGIYSHGIPTAAARMNAPQSLLVPAELFQVFVQSVVSPLAWVLAALFYIDMRVRREALDFDLKLSGQQA